MSSPVSRKISSVLAVLALIAVSSVGASAEAPPASPVVKRAEAPTVDRILTGFARVEGLEASFREEKHLSLLAAPLVTEGTLYFTRPGYLARVVNGPPSSKVIITPTAVKMRSDTGTETIDLRARPDVKTFVESFTKVLAGDRTGLERVYQLSVKAPEGDSQPGSWVLTMTPKGDPLAKLITALEVRGAGPAVQSVTVRERAGDHSVIAITKPDPKRVFSAEERARIFEITTP